MCYLTFIEKETIRRLFGISGGFIFKFWSDNGSYNKNVTHDLILDACGIDIYSDKRYSDLSQQKCIEKIWNEESPQTVAKLLSSLCDYFCFRMGTSYWDDDDSFDYRQVEEIIERLKNLDSIDLPAETATDNLKVLIEDIEESIKRRKPEMTLDRLHTFSTEFFRRICRQHGINTADASGNEYPLHSLVGSLRKWYRDNNYFESEFCVVAIQNTISIFEKFNSIRNNQSAAHPNTILNRIEAEYVLKVVIETLKFVEKIENASLHETSHDLSTPEEDMGDLPF